MVEYSVIFAQLGFPRSSKTSESSSSSSYAPRAITGSCEDAGGARETMAEIMETNADVGRRRAARGLLAIEGVPVLSKYRLIVRRIPRSRWLAERVLAFLLLAHFATQISQTR